MLNQNRGNTRRPGFCPRSVEAHRAPEEKEDISMTGLQPGEEALRVRNDGCSVATCGEIPR